MSFTPERSRRTIISSVDFMELYTVVFSSRLSGSRRNFPLIVGIFKTLLSLEKYGVSKNDLVGSVEKSSAPSGVVMEMPVKSKVCGLTGLLNTTSMVLSWSQPELSNFGVISITFGTSWHFG